MPLDFNNPESRKTYFSEKLDDLLINVNQEYGTLLLEELFSRLNDTIEKYNNEIKGFVEKLIETEIEKEEMLKKIKSGLIQEKKEEQKDSGDKEDLTPWERKLLEIEKVEEEQ